MKNSGYTYVPPGVRIHSGHVYLIAPAKPRKSWAEGIGTLQFKIGVSKSIDGVYKRLKDLSTGNWIQLTIATISPEVIHPFNVELFLHDNYSKNKIRGEWFKLSYAEYQYIIALLEREPDAFDSMRDRGAAIREWGHDPCRGIEFNM